MKRTYKLIIKITARKMSAECESDAFSPAELGIIFGKMAAIADRAKENFMSSAIPAEHRGDFLSAFHEARTKLPPDGSYEGFAVAPGGKP